MTVKRRWRPSLPFLLLAGTMALVAESRRAGATGDVPNIAFVYPAGGQQGTTFEVTVSGVHLKGATEVRFTGEGLTAKVLPEEPEDPKKAQPKKPKTSEDRDEETIRLSVTIAPGAPCGLRGLRVLTPNGASNRYRFVVGQDPEIVEKEPNSSKDQAQVIPSLPAAVNGQVFSADEDFFRFKAKAGQTVVCEVLGQALQPFIPDAVPGWLQATLTLHDAAGGELAYVDDFRFKPDPVLIYKVRKDGEYVVAIKDAIFRGRGDFVYRLRIGELPYLTDVYPLGGRRGATATVQLKGANLDKQALSIPLPTNGPDLRHVEATCGGRTSNAVHFEAGELEEIDEKEDNDSIEKANRLKAPVTVNGRIDKPGDADCFVLTAKAKETLVIDVRARRLDSPLDSLLTVLTSKARELVQNDDTEDKCRQLMTHHADSRLVYTFPSDGDYVVRLEDVQGKGGPEYAYRLTVAPPRPDFALRILPDNPCIAPGDTAVLKADALRLDGFSGEIQLSLRDLPKGYEARGLTLPAKEDEVRFTITAPDDAKPGLLQPKLVGTAKIGDRETVRQAQPAEEIQQAFSYIHRIPTEELLLAVVKRVPFALTTDAPADGPLQVVQGGEAQVKVKVIRRKDEPEPEPAPTPDTPDAKGKKAPPKKAAPKASQASIRLAAEEPPKGITVRTTPIAPDKDEATVTVLVPKQFAVGYRQNLILAGTMKLGKDTLTAYAPAVVIEVIPEKPAPKAPAPAAKPAAKPSPPKPNATPKTTPKKPEPKAQPKPEPKKPEPAPKPADKK